MFDFVQADAKAMRERKFKEFFLHSFDLVEHLSRMSIVLSLAIFLTSPIPIRISTSLEFESLK